VVCLNPFGIQKSQVEPDFTCPGTSTDHMDRMRTVLLLMLFCYACSLSRSLAEVQDLMNDRCISFVHRDRYIGAMSSPQPPYKSALLLVFRCLPGYLEIQFNARLNAQLCVLRSSQLWRAVPQGSPDKVHLSNDATIGITLAIDRSDIFDVCSYMFREKSKGLRSLIGNIP
jgi:hypothetical protein